MIGRHTIEHRLALLTITSAYRLEGDNALHRIAGIMPSQATNPWFWPGVDSIVMCPVDPTDVVQPPPRPPLTPERTGSPIAEVSAWSTIWETLEDGRRMIVGRYPSFSQLWGNVIDRFPDVITLQSFDAFQGALASGASYREASRLLLPGHTTTPPAGPGLLMPKVGIIGPPVLAGEERYVDEHGRRPRQIRPPNGQNCWERISCIGLDIDRKAVTATIEILQSSGYGGSLCDSSSFESVGFWLVEPSHAELEPQDWPQSPRPNRNSGTPLDPCGGSVRFLGSTSVKVADIARADQTSVVCANPALRYNAKPLHYTVSLELRDEDLDLMRFCSEDARLPALHCVLRWNVNVRNANYGGAGVQFGDTRTCVVQFPLHNSLPADRRVLAVGILHEDCERVLLSPFIRQGIDRFAVQITKPLVDFTQQYGSLRFVLISAKEQTTLARTTPFSNLRVGLQSRVWRLGDIETLSNVLPFESVQPPTGSWLLCAVFGENADDWDPRRDLVMTGDPSSDSISIVSVASTFLNNSIEMAGPLYLDPIAFDYREFSSDSDFRHFPPCLTDTPSIHMNQGDCALEVFYPIRLGDAPTPSNLAKIEVPDSIVFIIPANGTGYQSGGWRDYKTLIRQFVLQGFIVAFQIRKVTGSDYGLTDSLRPMLSAILSKFPQVNEPTLFFVGHSQGGNQVAFLLSDATAVSSIPFRIAGGVLLAPTIHSGDMRVMHAPIVTFWGALDSDIRLINLRCDDTSWTQWTLSPLWYYTNAVGPFNAFIFAAGATHFRWIDSEIKQDDYYKVRGITERYDIERSLILDGPDGTSAPYREHFAILLSYSTYFIRACLLNELSLLAPILSPYILPPDIYNLQRSLHVREGLKVYYTGPDNDNLNSFGQLDSYFYKGVGVRRSIVGQNRRSLTTTSAVYRDPSSVVQDVCAAINVDVVVAEGQAVEMLFELTPSLSVLSSDLLSLEFVVLDINGRPVTRLYKVVVTLFLRGGKEYEVEVGNTGMSLSNLRLTKLKRSLEEPGAGVDLMLALGDVLLLQSFRMRLDWIISECFSNDMTRQGAALQPSSDSGSQLTTHSLASIRVSCVSDDASELIFGMSSLKLSPSTTHMHAI